MENLQLVKQNNSFTEEKFDHVINSIMLACAVEVPMTIIAGILPNLEFFGRKGTLMFGYGFTAFFAGLIYLYPTKIEVLSCFYKAAISFPFNTILIYTSEVFPTHMKVTALGLSNFFCRFGGFSNPFLIEILFRFDPILPFLALSGFGALGFVFSFMLPYETLGRKIF